jgi:hypothetical protein
MNVLIFPLPLKFTFPHLRIVCFITSRTLWYPYNGFVICESGKYIPNRFLIATRCLLNLSSGENLAG